ncbi:MAG: methyltransferase domain-containing protein [Clostridium sp.]|uniref:class I SAM-dependent methyltransferase n=1 Tax=Clostridium sp. TaxID=1506 RepID=UPI00302B9320
MDKINVIKRNTCRICKNEKLRKWLTLKQMPLTDNMDINKIGNEVLYDININVCENCLVSQTSLDIACNEYYNDYNYSVNSSETANRFMHKLCDKLWENYNLTSQSKILEIGSSDGSQLNYFKIKGAKVLGVEPSLELCNISRSRGVSVCHGLFDNSAAESILKEFNKVDLVILEYTFDHLPDPMDALNIISKILNDDGLIVLEVHNLDLILKRKEYCLFEHEHTVYLSEETIKVILENVGFEVVDFNLLKENEKRANSLLVVAKLKNKKNEVIKSRKKITKNFNEYEKFSEDLSLSLNKIDRFISDNVNRGKKIAGFGAGGRGVMTLAAIPNGNKLLFICDNNTMMQGLYTPKTHIQIVDPCYLKENQVDILIVFSFGYIDEIKKQIETIINKDTEIVNFLDLL